MDLRIAMVVNGALQEHDVEARTLLVQYLRERAGLTGTKVGCDTSACGACTVLVDGESVKSCTMLAAQADGRSVTTIEGVEIPNPTEADVRVGLEGNLCRCTGYHNIVKAVLAAAETNKVGVS